MKLNCGMTAAESAKFYDKKFNEWHRWFAWYPVRVGQRDCRWLETVERRAAYGQFGAFRGLLGFYLPWNPEYREAQP